MKTMYVANDGMMFTNKDRCEEYEKKFLEKKKYEVELYFTGTYYTTVSANSEEEAYRIAYEGYEVDDIDWVESKDHSIVELK